MNNDELLIALKDVFEKKVDEVKYMFEKKVDEVKRHTGVLFESLRGDIKAGAEGHSVLDRKIDSLQKDLTETKQELKESTQELTHEINILKNNLDIVKDYVTGVDAKLNEHEVILKRAK